MPFWTMERGGTTMVLAAHQLSAVGEGRTCDRPLEDLANGGARHEATAASELVHPWSGTSWGLLASPPLSAALPDGHPIRQGSCAPGGSRPGRLQLPRRSARARRGCGPGSALLARA